MKKALKRSLSLLLAITIIVGSAYVGLSKIDFGSLFAVRAKAASIDDLRFTLNEDGESYSVTGCISTAEGKLDVPSFYNGLPVTGIANEAFYYCTQLTSITIPNSVTSIGSDAFYYCSSIKEVYITDITAWCGISFGNKSSNPLFKGANLHLNGELLAEVVFPDSVTTIPSYAFYNCKSLTSITIPDSVTSIGSDAFYYCSNIKDVYISDIVAWCGISFDNYSANPLNKGANLYLNGKLLVEVVIPDSVTSIGDCAFGGCRSLTSVTIPGSVTNIGSSAFRGCKGLTSITIPGSVKSIGAYAFYDCSGFTSITIPKGVTSLGNYAFYNCSNLTSIIIPDSLTSIGESAFYICSSLEDVYITDISKWCGISFGGSYSNPLRYAKNLYLNDELVTDIVIPNGVTIIPGYAFSCNNLTSITIPDSVTSIGYSAFENCTNLTSITIPDSVTSIGSSSFRGCKVLASITIPDSVTNIGASAFYDCTGITSIVLPDSVTSISNDVFYGCSGLTSITIPYSVTSIGSSAFRACLGLTSITIPESVTSIGNYAFYNCSNLGQIYYLGLLDDWSNITIGSNNSCLTNANISHLCTYGDWVISSQPTCTEEGSKSRYCVVCGIVAEIITIPCHVDTIWITEKEPTCTVPGYKDCYCLDCGELIGTEEIPTTVHPNKTWITEQEPTCTVAGYKNCYCLDCGEVIGTEEISVIAHSYGDWVVDTAPTCTEEGAKHQTCSACGDIVTGIIEPNGHNHSTEWITDIEPTCTEEGSKSYHCTVCGDKANITSVQATGHSYGDWIVDLASTCTEKGAKHQTCSSCGDIVTGAIEAKGHNHSTEWTIDIKPTCTEEGSKSHHCTVCGDKTDITAIKALGHDYTVVSTEAEHPHLSMFKCTLCSSEKQEGIYSPACNDCNFLYDIVDDESCKITGYIGTGSLIKLPGFIDERVVATTTTGAFKNNTTVTSVIIEDGVQSLGALAFLGCSSLSKVVIPESVTSIGASAFHNCASDFTIYCFRDSYTMQYAIDNSLNYVVMDIGETENCTIDYSNNMIFSSKDGVNDLMDIIYAPETSTVSVQASLGCADNEFLGTGSKIIVVDNGVSAEYTLIVNGDTNGDSVCDALDAAQVANASNGLEALDGAYKMAADSNYDDEISVEDYQAVVNKVIA